MNRYRPDIEGLRAVAILLVVLYHAGLQPFTGGYVGVDVFFVLSGYLITNLLLEESDRSGTVDFARFFARRARRLLPAASVMLLACMGLGALLYAPIEQDRLANTTLSAAAYASNLYFTRASADYFAAQSHTNPLLHTWSLSVEEQFYFFWPFLIVLLRRGRSDLDSNRRLLVGMAAAGVMSFAAAVYLTGVLQPWAFFLSPPRAWEFALGGLLAVPRPSAVVALTSRRYATAVRMSSGWLGLAAILGSGVVYGESTIFPGTSALVPTLGTALVLVSGESRSGGVRSVLEVNWVRAIGKLSYSWYLWHWPFLVFTGAIDATLGVGNRIAVVLGSLVVAYASYHYVEEPIRRGRRLQLASWNTLLVAAAAAAIFISVAIGWKMSALRWAASPEQAKFSAMKNDYAEIYRMGCDDYFHSAAVNECVFGPSNASRTAFLLGDSHAGHWFPAVRTLFAERPEWRLVVLTKSSCPVVNAPYFSNELGRVYTECSQWLSSALLRIHDVHPDLILASNASDYPFTPNEWKQGMRSAVQSLSASSSAVLLIRDVPSLGSDGPDCLARLAWRPQFLSRGDSCETLLSTEPDPVFALQQRMGGEFWNVVTIDLTGSVCPERVCRVMQNGVVTYRDEQHLSTAFAKSLTPALRSQLDSALAAISRKSALARNDVPRLAPSDQ